MDKEKVRHLKAAEVLGLRTYALIAVAAFEHELVVSNARYVTPRATLASKAFQPQRLKLLGRMPYPSTLRPTRPIRVQQILELAAGNSQSQTARPSICMIPEFSVCRRAEDGT